MINPLTKTFLRYLMVGVINTLIGYGIILIGLNIVHLGYNSATAVGYTIGLICSFFLNRKFTFRNQQAISQTWWRFLLVVLIAYGIAWWGGRTGAQLLLATTHHTAVSQQQFDNLAALINLGIYTVIGFLGNNFFAFRQV